MPRVLISAKQIPMPTACVCCGQPPNATMQARATRTKGKRVVRSESREWTFPACTRCLAHARAMPDASNYQVVAILPPVLLAIAAFPVGVAAACTWMPVVWLLYRISLGSALSMRCATCEGSRNLVSYEGWYGTDHSFSMDSPRYAQALADAARAAKKTVQLDLRALSSAHAPPSPGELDRLVAWRTRARVVAGVIAVLLVSFALGHASRQASPDPPSRGVPGLRTIEATGPTVAQTTALEDAGTRADSARPHRARRPHR